MNARSFVPAASAALLVLVAAGAYGAGQASRQPAGQVQLLGATQPSPLPAPVVGAPVRTITVTGSGTVLGTPDTARVSFSITTTAAHVTDALAENNQRSAQLQALLQRDGIARSDIQTTQLWISPNYTGSPQPDGYQVTNGVMATIRNLATAGQVIDEAAQAAGDSIRLDGISLSFADDSSLLAAARSRAVQQARATAQQYASAAGVGLGQIQSISEQSSPQYPFYGGGVVSAAPSAVPIQPGQQSVQVQVTVVYAIV